MTLALSQQSIIAPCYMHSNRVPRTNIYSPHTDSDSRYFRGSIYRRAVFSALINRAFCLLSRDSRVCGSNFFRTVRAARSNRLGVARIRPTIPTLPFPAREQIRKVRATRARLPNITFVPSLTCDMDSRG